MRTPFAKKQPNRQGFKKPLVQGAKQNAKPKRKYVYPEDQIVRAIVRNTNDKKLDVFKSRGIKLSQVKYGIKYRRLRADIYDLISNIGYFNLLENNNIMRVVYKEPDEFSKELVQREGISMNKICKKYRIRVPLLLFGMQVKRLIPKVYDSFVQAGHKDLLDKYNISTTQVS